jgi:hypothetical protein
MKKAGKARGAKKKSSVDSHIIGLGLYPVEQVRFALW